jgi:hypothetical protein
MAAAHGEGCAAYHGLNAVVARVKGPRVKGQSRVLEAAVRVAGSWCRMPGPAVLLPRNLASRAWIVAHLYLAIAEHG